MLENTLGYQIGGNNIVQLGLFLLIIFLSLVAVKIMYVLFKKIFKAVTKKTKTMLDDILVEALESPVIFAMFLGGIYFGRGVLTLSETMLVRYNIFLSSFVIINITWFVVRIVDALMLNYFHPKAKSKVKIDQTLYPLIKKLVNFAILAIAFIVLIQDWGYNVSSLVAGLGIGGLAFALAAQDVLSNMFGGAALVTDKPFKIGDRIVVSGKDGFVKEIGIRTTILETFDGTHVVIPNKNIADSVLENISRERARRVKLILGVEYATSTEKLEEAKKVLAEIVKENEKTDDKSLIHFTNFGSSSLDIQVIYWIKDLDNILTVKDEINFKIKAKFEEIKVEFAFPSQTVYLKK